MALQGNLRDFSLVQLLNLINLAKKTGCLYVQTETQAARLYFREGKLLYAAIGDIPVPLVRVMARVRLIPNSVAASLGERLRAQNDKEAGINLINAGYLSQDQIIQGIGSFYAEIIRELYNWRDGVFGFGVGEAPPANVIPVRVDLESIIIEGSRQLNELEDLRHEIPSLEMCLKFAERPGMNIRNVNLNAEEWRVVSYVNTKNTIKQIANAAKLNELQIRRVVYDLLQAGLVELVRPAIAPIPSVVRTLPPRDPIEQRSLVNRVIDRIKSI